MEIPGRRAFVLKWAVLEHYAHCNNLRGREFQRGGNSEGLRRQEGHGVKDMAHCDGKGE